jgi:hypothetical protein
MPAEEKNEKNLYINLGGDLGLKTPAMYFTLNGNDRFSFFQQQVKLVEHIGRFFKEIFLQQITFSNELVSALSCISKHCTQLRYLSMDSFVYPNFPQEELVPFLYKRVSFQNHSVEKLGLSYCTPTTEILSYILNYFPSLKF